MLEDEDNEPSEAPYRVVDIINTLMPTIETNRNQETPRFTEDGVLVRKIHVSNLPPQVSRSELYRAFIRYGIIDKIWMKRKDNDLRNCEYSYAFVTFSCPIGAQRALNSRDIIIRGWKLKVVRADTWHQPVNCGNQNFTAANIHPPIATVSEPSPSTSSGLMNVENSENSILNILNTRCIQHIFSYIPLNDLIRSERVSKDWQAMVHYHVKGKQKLNTSEWNHHKVPLTTAKFRKLVNWIDGKELESLSISQRVSFYNDRIVPSICKLCPNLQELKVLGLSSVLWTPLFIACKKLNILEFISCRINDGSLMHIGSYNVKIEHLAVAFNTLVTGSFLVNIRNDKIKSLILCACDALDGCTVINNLEVCPQLEFLKIDGCPNDIWQYLPEILSKVPNLVELSLTNYYNVTIIHDHLTAFTSVRNLRKIHLKNNAFVNNQLLELISKNCSKLTYLDVSICNYNRLIPDSGVTDEGIRHVLKRCPLTHLDVSHVLAFNGSSLSDEGATLNVLIAHGCPMLVAPALAPVVARSTLLELDVCECPVGAELVAAAAVAMTKRCTQTSLKIWLAGTPAAAEKVLFPTHKLLTVDVKTSRCKRDPFPGCSTFFFEKSSNGCQISVKEIRDPGPVVDIMDVIKIFGHNLNLHGIDL